MSTHAPDESPNTHIIKRKKGWFATETAESCTSPSDPTMMESISPTEKVSRFCRATGTAITKNIFISFFLFNASSLITSAAIAPPLPPRFFRDSKHYIIIIKARLQVDFQ